MSQAHIKEIISRMTLEEKAGMCSGEDFWHTKAVQRLGISPVMVSDGPFGLRKQAEGGDHLGVNESIQAVCFPASCATASSFDKGLLIKMGETLGNECQAENVSTILGPAINIKRSPLCGRNFEYFSEDPYLAGEMAKSHITGVQSKNVGTSIKHFLANNQEYRRLTSDSVIDERTLREIYLTAFEIAVKDSKPWTVMCSYNKINGVYAAENKTYLTDVLRKEWGFDGYVMSDWGAVNHRVKDLDAGLDLEMPSSFGETDQTIVKAVQSGEISESILDQAVERILNIVFRYQENRDTKAKWNMEADHALACEMESECAVLLKNDGILPLKKNGSVAFIGAYAKKPRFQGGGSSHINSFRTTNAMDAAKELNITNQVEILHAQGFIDNQDETDEKLLAEAIEVARKVDKVVIFAGLPDSFESEGYDRTHMRMPTCQVRLIEEIAKVNPEIVVALHNGSPVEMPWINCVKGILELYLGGQGVGVATVKLLFGDQNPSGKLPETFPLRLEDNPSFLTFGGEDSKVVYNEGIFVGYRYYDKKNMNVLFPFGYGLSYTNFAYSNLSISADHILDTDTLKVSVDITNEGSVFGKEIVQLYVAPKCNGMIRPVRELKGFEKVALLSGERKTVFFTLAKRDFSYYSVKESDWVVESGDYGIEIGASSRDLLLTKDVHVTSSIQRKVIYTLDTPLGEIVKNPQAKEIMQPLIDSYMFGNSEDGDYSESGDAAAEAISEEMVAAMQDQTPLRSMVPFGNGKITYAQIKELLEKANNM